MNSEEIDKLVNEELHRSKSRSNTAYLEEDNQLLNLPGEILDENTNKRKRKIKQNNNKSSKIRTLPPLKNETNMITPLENVLLRDATQVINCNGEIDQPDLIVTLPSFTRIPQIQRVEESKNKLTINTEEKTFITVK